MDVISAVALFRVYCVLGNVMQAIKISNENFLKIMMRMLINLIMYVNTCCELKYNPGVLVYHLINTFYYCFYISSNNIGSLTLIHWMKWDRGLMNWSRISLS